MESTQSSVSATRGATVTLPCHFRYEPEVVELRRTRVKWSWLPANTIYVPADASAETEVIVAIGNHLRSYGSFRGRVSLRRSGPGDLSLVIERLQVNDTGRYRCEVIDGLEDESVSVELKLRGACVKLWWCFTAVVLLHCCCVPPGVVFPYHSEKGRYHFNFFGAGRACQDQDASLATPEQLLTAWEEGLDWCNAGWLADGTVQYPIAAPRDGCGGAGSAPGLRTYGKPHRLLGQFDAFCFSASIKGQCERVKQSANSHKHVTITCERPRCRPASARPGSPAAYLW